MTPDEFSFDFDLLCALTEADGVPGYEDRVRDLVWEELADSVDDLRSDAMGNVIGTVHGDSEYAVAVAAHMDEIGFMVTHVNDDGFIRLDPLGGWDPRVLRAQRVTIHTDTDDVPGVIGQPPPHTQDDDTEETDDSLDNIYIDVGLPADDVKTSVAPGDLVTMRQSTTVIGNMISGKALDDRVCLLAMLEVARRTESPPVTIHFAATVQEEVGLRGAEALGVDLAPDLALSLDVTVANDIPGFEDAEYVTRLGEGTAIKLKDSSVITNPKVNRRLRGVAEAEDIPYQLEILPRGGTDTARFQNAAGATPVGAISVPTRYLHSVTESAHYGDIEATINLLAAFLETETGDHDYSF